MRYEQKYIPCSGGEPLEAFKFVNPVSGFAVKKDKPSKMSDFRSVQEMIDEGEADISECLDIKS